jgi:SAM-dependent methyltransferase
MLPITVATPIHHGTVSGHRKGVVDRHQHPIRRWATLPHRRTRSRSRELEAGSGNQGMRWDPGKLRADFDRLAGLSHDGWDHNAHYHRFLLGQLPPRCRQALDVGCGTGAFARLLAERCDRVLAIDLAPRMVEVARSRSAGHPNLEYRVADATTWPLPPGRFDCVASIAAAHHLPLAPFLTRLREALAPGGTLLLLDIYRPRNLADLVVSLAAVPASRLLGLRHTGRLSQPPELRQAWEEHGRTDRYLSLTEVREACAGVLPGAAVRRHLLWRYSIVWHRPP